MAPTVWLGLLLPVLAAQAYRTTLRDRTGNIEITADLGIPYAKAATFERPIQQRDRDKDESTYEQKCPQDSLNSQDYNQDCLHLNIYRRKDPNNGGTKKPVVVYLHPGMFHWGSKDMVGPKNLLATTDIVLVTVNYRLGALGFLSTNDSDAPGNLGLWDQNEALLWVNQNIDRYGGKSDSITLMGHGAGAACVGFHLLRSGSRPQFFHRAVMISGGPLDPWAIQTRPREEAEILAERLSCPKSRYNMVRCIASKGAERIVKATEQEPKLFFGPVIDNNTRENFLAGDPRWLLTQPGRSLPDIPVLLGHAAREGSFYFYEKNKDIQQNLRVDLALGQFLRPLLNDSRNLDSIVAAVKYHYYIRGKENASSVDVASAHIIQALSDFMYASGADQLYRLFGMNTGGKTYRYIFNYTSTSAPSLLDSLSGYVNKEKAGVTHLSDIFYYFDTTLGRGSGTLIGQDINMADTMAKIIDSFVKDQNPPSIQTAQSYKLNRQQESIYVIESLSSYPKPNALEWQERMDLWNVLVPELESIDVTPDPDPELGHFRSATWGLTAFLVILIIVATLAGSVVLYRRKQRRPTPRDSNLQGKELAKL